MYVLRVASTARYRTRVAWAVLAAYIAVLAAYIAVLHCSDTRPTRALTHMPHIATALESAAWRGDADAVALAIEVAGPDSASGYECVQPHD